jgi:hypothetical protein
VSLRQYGLDEIVVSDHGDPATERSDGGFRRREEPVNE